MRLLLLAWLSLPLLAIAQENPLAELIGRSAQSTNPSLVFLEGLGALEATEIDRDELENVLYSLDAQGIVIPRALGVVLDDLEQISLGEYAESHRAGERRSRDVSFTFSQAPAPIDLNQGWAHLGEEVSFVLADRSDGSTQLQRFDGFRVGRTEDGMALGLKWVHFDTRSENPVATVKVPFVAPIEVPLNPAPRPEEPVVAVAEPPALSEPPPADPELSPVAEPEPAVAESEPEPEPAVAESEPDPLVPGDPVMSLPADVLAQDDQLAGLIEHAAASERPLLTLIAGFRELDQATFTGEQVRAVLSDLEDRGVEVPGVLHDVLDDVQAIELGRVVHASERGREKGKLRKRRVEFTYAEPPDPIDLSQEWEHLDGERVILHFGEEVAFWPSDRVDGSIHVWPIAGVQADRLRTRFRDEHVNLLSMRFEPDGVARLRAGLFLNPVEVPLGSAAAGANAPTRGLTGSLLD